MTRLLLNLELSVLCTSSCIFPCVFAPKRHFATQEDPTRHSGGVPFSLANKFTSETSPGAGADDVPDQKLGGVDPASRPAGLTLRTPTINDFSAKSAAAGGQGEENDRAEEIRNPIRRTIDWIPAPLLCKRLNVPVPKASSTVDWAAKGSLQAGALAAAAPKQDALGSLRKFVQDSSISSRSQVKLRVFRTPASCSILGFALLQITKCQHIASAFTCS